MSLALTQTYTAIAAGLTASFLGTGGTAPYTYAVTAGGAGGSINASTGIYTAPAELSTDLAKAFDVVVVTDSASPTPATASSTILVGNVYQLFCDVIQHGMGLDVGRVYLWDQKIMQPTDSGLYVAVSVSREKVFANNGRFGSDGTYAQYASVMATLGIDVISRSALARDQKELVLMTLNSVYAEQQMEKNTFFIGRLPPGSQFVNLSLVDGAAIPYRFHIDINVQYVRTKAAAVDYFDTFASPTVATNP